MPDELRPDEPTTEPPASAGDALFAGPRHFRGDARLLRTALRRGWLKDTPDERIGTLAGRLMAGYDERQADGFTTADSESRHGLGFAKTAIALEWLNARRCDEALDQLIRSMPMPARPPGRPRLRPRRSDDATRLDAAELVARARAEGRNLDALIVAVRRADRSDEPATRIAIELVPMPRGARRAFFRCPRCLSRRAHLYPDANGVGCRTCGVVDYARREPTSTADGRPENEAAGEKGNAPATS